MNIPMVSVVLPVYNAEKYIDEAIQSILNQSYLDFEFIIINDGSTDKSLEIIEKYKQLDDRIFIINRGNKGLVASLNEGIEQAKGRYIARMDADDISLPTRFEKQVKLMENNSIDICGCHYAMINKFGKYIDIIYTPLDNNSLFLYLIEAVPFAHGSVMIRKNFLRKHNLMYGQNKIKYAEDKALWSSMYKFGARFGNVNEVLFEYREFNESLSKIKSNVLKKDDRNIRLEFINIYFRDIKNSVISLNSSVDNLSNRELEYLGDLSLFLFFFKKDFTCWKIFKNVPARYKIISFFKFLSKLVKWL